MRIRKNASKILGTASSLPPPQPPPQLLADVSSSGYICVLNQSPWDVFPSPPPHNPQDEGSIGDWNKGEESISAVTRSNTSALPDDQLPEAMKRMKNAKGKRVIVKMAKEDYIVSSAWGETPTYACKKTDGKQWQCKRPAHQPNSLCEHHLSQIKSYNYKVPSVAKAASVGKCTQRKRVTMPSATSAISDIYYYSSFGPWRGKQRGGGDTVVVDEDRGSDRAKESYDNMDVSDEDESWEDSELEEKQIGNDSNPHVGSRKKRRKPVKSRSLKSLM